MEISLLHTILLIHLLVSAVYIVLIVKKVSSLTPASILPILCIPFFGAAAAAAADLVNKSTGRKEAEPIETLSLSEDIYWKTIKKREEAQNIVPLEEALIINDRITRKKLVLEMLLDDPMKNIDILLLARENNDVDTAHYANTTIAKIQRDFQLQIQQMAVAYENDPKKTGILDKYIETMWRFIESGLSEAYLLRKQRIILSTLLDDKLARDSGDKETLYIKIQNSLALKEINEAMDAAAVLKESYPDDEQTWINALRVSVSAHDALQLEETVDAIKHRKIEWSPEDKNLINTWVKIK